MDWLQESPWLAWLGVALLAGVVEVLTLDFVFVMIAGGAVIASVTAALGAPFAVQVLVFAVASVLLLFTVRPILKRWAATTPIHVTNAGALVGREALVLEPVTDRTGQVKLAGEVWTARTAGGAALTTGARVVVLRIDGATAVVGPEVPAV
ncbi:NfeD family protein [Spongisporangium articulatum]|uniref:NfeD family protein n=1 Tax=Spongisporangium articulatum TaxID=3362603 RepID=A0ABW8ARQ9_9ACTN